MKRPTSNDLVNRFVRRWETSFVFSLMGQTSATMERSHGAGQRTLQQARLSITDRRVSKKNLQVYDKNQCNHDVSKAVSAEPKNNPALEREEVSRLLNISPS